MGPPISSSQGYQVRQKNWGKQLSCHRLAQNNWSYENIILYNTNIELFHLHKAQFLFLVVYVIALWQVTAHCYQSPHYKREHYWLKRCLMPFHDDVIKWEHFPRYWPFVWGIHRSPVNSPHKGQWRGALMFSFICARMNGWENTREAGDIIMLVIRDAIAPIMTSQ